MESPIDLFRIFIHPLNVLGLPYMVTGSAASMTYGEPRMTLDVDLVIELPQRRIPDLLAAFPEQAFYCPPSDVLVTEVTRETRGHFNIIHMDTGFKADFYPAGRDDLHVWGMAHRHPTDMNGETIMLAPPEYVILRKLQYFQEGGSFKHVHDIAGMLRLWNAPLDLSFIREWVSRLHLEEAWSRFNPKA